MAETLGDCPADECRSFPFATGREVIGEPLALALDPRIDRAPVHSTPLGLDDTCRNCQRAARCHLRTRD